MTYPDSFDVRLGNITVNIPNNIEIDREIVDLSRSDVARIDPDYFDNLHAIEMHVETPTTGTTSIVIELNMYGSVDVTFGTIRELNGQDRYEHPDDCPYDSLPDSPVSRKFVESIQIVRHDDEIDED